jgi:hypothetical protein
MLKGKAGKAENNEKKRHEGKQQEGAFNDVEDQHFNYSSSVEIMKMLENIKHAVAFTFKFRKLAILYLSGPRKKKKQFSLLHKDHRVKR